MHELPPFPEPARRSVWIFVPPPPLFIAAFIAGVQIGHIVPLALLPEGWATAELGVASVAMLFAVGLVASAPLLFLRHRTTIIPHRDARKLVTTGPYRITRNPMYLALVVGYVAVALAMNLAWPLVLLAVPVWLMDRKVIPGEEAALERMFGDDYRAYAGKVRRWI